MGCRRLWALVNGLRPEAATWRKEQEWTTRDELVAGLIEHIDWWARQFAVMNGVKQSKVPMPVQILRPGEREKRKGPSGVLRMLEGLGLKRRG